LKNKVLTQTYIISKGKEYQMPRLNNILLLSATAAMIASLDSASFRIVNAENSELNILAATTLALLTLGIIHRAPIWLITTASLTSIFYLAILGSGAIELPLIPLIPYIAIFVVATAFVNILSERIHSNDNTQLHKYILHFLAVSIGLSALLTALQSTPLQYTISFLSRTEIFIISAYIAATNILSHNHTRLKENNRQLSKIIALTTPYAIITILAILFSNFTVNSLTPIIYGFLLILTFLQLVVPRGNFSGAMIPTMGANVAIYFYDQTNTSLIGLIGSMIVIPTFSAIIAHLKTLKDLNAKRAATSLTRLLKQNDTIISKYDNKNQIFILDDPSGKSEPKKITAIDAFRHASSSSILNFYAAMNSKNKNAEKLIIKLSLSPNESEHQLDGGTLYSTTIFPNDGDVFEVFIKNIEEEVQNANLMDTLDAMLAKALLKEEHLLALASHELRTPLSIIEMLTEELQDGAAWEDIETDFLRTSNRLSRILEDLRLATSTDNAVPVAKPFSINDITSVLKNTFSSAAAVNECSLQIKNSENALETYVADYTRIIAALTRVLQNAIVHAPKSKITLSYFLSQTEDNKFMLTWQIADTGPGIDPQRLDTIFRPFQEVSNVDGNGTAGLGLYTARAAMRIIGGDLRYERSDGVTRFIVAHPVLKLDERSMSSQTTNTESKMAKFCNKAALLVEDTQLVGEITVSRLSKFFGEVYWAKTGNAGLELYKKHKPDIVFMDHLLPEMNGDKVTAAIRELDKTVPIIGITASALGSECDLLEAAGANYALEKPLKLSQIDLIVTEFFMQR
jgi:signal transduction histidine kinase